MKSPLYANVKLTNACDLMCNGCRLYDPNYKNDNTAAEEIELKELNKLKLPKIVNICGGDPLLADKFADILTALKTAKHFIMLSTNGIHLNELNKDIFKLINLPILYLPAIDKKSVSRECGLDCYERILSAVNYLEEIKKKHIINFPITPITVEFIPDLITKFENNKYSFLWLNYQPNIYGHAKKASKNYLSHYAGRKNVLVSKYFTDQQQKYCFAADPALEKLTFSSSWFLIKLFSKVYL